MKLTKLLKSVPWDLWYAVKYVIRKHYGQKTLDDGTPCVVLDGDINLRNLETALRKRHFEAAEYSYYYKGQMWGLRRPEYVENSDYIPESRFYSELHIRSFVLNQGIVLVPHREPSRYEEKEAHTDGDYIMETVGCKLTSDILDDMDIEHHRSTI